jgi:hypothetical protein
LCFFAFTLTSMCDVLSLMVTSKLAIYSAILKIHITFILLSSKRHGTTFTIPEVRNDDDNDNDNDNNELDTGLNYNMLFYVSGISWLRALILFSYHSDSSFLLFSFFLLYMMIQPPLIVIHDDTLLRSTLWCIDILCLRVRSEEGIGMLLYLRVQSKHRRGFPFALAKNCWQFGNHWYSIWDDVWVRIVGCGLVSESICKQLIVTVDMYICWFNWYLTHTVNHSNHSFCSSYKFSPCFYRVCSSFLPLINWLYFWLRRLNHYVKYRRYHATSLGEDYCIM